MFKLCPFCQAKQIKEYNILCGICSEPSLYPLSYYKDPRIKPWPGACYCLVTRLDNNRIRVEIKKYDSKTMRGV